MIALIRSPVRRLSEVSWTQEKEKELTSYFCEMTSVRSLVTVPLAHQLVYVRRERDERKSSKLFPRSSKSRHPIVVRNCFVDRVWGTLLDAGTYITSRGLPFHEDDARKLPGFERSRKRESASTTKRISTSSRLDAFRYTDWRYCGNFTDGRSKARGLRASRSEPAQLSHVGKTI